MSTQEQSLMKRRILFVDDEPSVLDGLRRMLRAERGRWDMRFAENADEALREMHETDVDAVVSDVDMPGRDGLELLQEIRRTDRTRDIPVVILTGRNDSGLKRRALDLGAGPAQQTGGFTRLGRAPPQRDSSQGVSG